MKHSLTRRDFLVRGAGLGLALTTVERVLEASLAKTPMLVYMDPDCGCCATWVSLMGAAGFEVSVRNTSDMEPIKRRYGIGDALASCHTAVLSGYLVEGHVPADLIQKMLRDKPKIAGLTVPGMVEGSPGMEGPNPQKYDVLACDAAGKTTVYAKR